MTKKDFKKAIYSTFLIGASELESFFMSNMDFRGIYFFTSNLVFDEIELIGYNWM